MCRFPIAHCSCAAVETSPGSVLKEPNVTTKRNKNLWCVRGCANARRGLCLLFVLFCCFGRVENALEKKMALQFRVPVLILATPQIGQAWHSGTRLAPLLSSIDQGKANCTPSQPMFWQRDRCDKVWHRPEWISRETDWHRSLVPASSSPSNPRRTFNVEFGLTATQGPDWTDSRQAAHFRKERTTKRGRGGRHSWRQDAETPPRPAPISAEKAGPRWCTRLACNVS